MLVKLLILAALLAIIIYYPAAWLIVLVSIIALFMTWYLFSEIKDLTTLPKLMTEKRSVADSGIEQVREFNIDRYIWINSYNDEGGQEFDGVRNLKPRMEFIEIMDSAKKRYYHTRVETFGKSLEPYYVFKKRLPDELFESDLWNDLTQQRPFLGKLEDLDRYISLDRHKD